MTMDDYPCRFDPIICVLDDYVPALEPGSSHSRVKLCTGDGQWTIATWLRPWVAVGSTKVNVARVTLIPCTIASDVNWVATQVECLPDASLIHLIPSTLGIDTEIVARFRNVVGCIQSEPLVMLLSRVWSLREVFWYFWTCPASQAHHHAFTGGLAVHSIEMAEWVAETPSVVGADRDIAIAYALLHDIGKLWCYGPEGYTRVARLGHELVGLTRIGDSLEALSHAWPDGAIALQSLLSGLWKRQAKIPLLAVGKLVQAYDQMSAEANLRPCHGHRYQPWTVLR